jgi:DNA polymerase-3 subunit epsilon
MLETKTALEALREVVSRENFVIVDTETTGVRDGEVCQVAIIDHTGKVMFDQLVKPVYGIPADATRVHGITEDDVESAPGWVVVAPLVRDIFAGRDVIAYNAVYDRKMMHKSAEAAGMDKIDWKVLSPWYCAMEAFAEWYGEWNDYYQSYRWQKLGFAASVCGVEVANAHNALGDCIMTLGVIRFISQNQRNEK